MNLNNIMFYERYPKLDLHGYDCESARVAINDFIRDHKKMKQEVVVIVHGIGRGTIAKLTKEVLRINKDVIESRTPFYNSGCTLVLIDIDE